MTDKLDLEAVAATRMADQLVVCAGLGEPMSDEALNLARCYLATRAREARLEALVRVLGKCRVCNGKGDHRGAAWCDPCNGTGLVEAARKELNDG